MTTEVNITFRGHKSNGAIDILDKIAIVEQNFSRNPCNQAT